MISHYKIKHEGIDFILGDIAGNKIEYNIHQTVRFLEMKGRFIYGRNFKIHKKDFDLIYKLLIYSIKDVENCKKHKLDLNKGLLLTGPIGCGKTTLINLIRFFVSNKNQYKIKSSRIISFEYMRDGHEIISNYCNTKNYCFDDLGLEQHLKRYGNDCNVMAEILLSRYDFFISDKAITHATTNLNALELEKYYGNQVRSRMRSMFNLLSFDKNTKDKRI